MPKAGGGQEQIDEKVRAVQEAQGIVRFEMDNVFLGKTKDEVKPGYRRIMMALHQDRIQTNWPSDKDLAETAVELYKWFSVLHAFVGRQPGSLDGSERREIQEVRPKLEAAKRKFLAWKPSQSKSAASQPQPAPAPKSNPKPAPAAEPTKPGASWHGGARPTWKNSVPHSPEAEPPASPPPPMKPPEAAPTSGPKVTWTPPEGPRVTWDSGQPQPPREPPPTRRADGAERMTDWGRAKQSEAAEKTNRPEEEQRVYKAIQERLTLIEGAIEEVEDNIRRSPPAKRAGLEKDLAAFREQQKECLYRFELLRRVFNFRKQVAEYTTTIRQSEEFLAQAAQYPDRKDVDWLNLQTQAKGALQRAQLFIGRAKWDLLRDEPLVESIVKNWKD